MRIHLATGTEDSWTGGRGTAPFLLTGVAGYPTNYSVETKVNVGTANGGVVPEDCVSGIVVYDTANEPGYAYSYDLGFSVLKNNYQAYPTILVQSCGEVDGVSGVNVSSSQISGLTSAYLKMVRDGVNKTWTCSYKVNLTDAWTQLAVVNDSSLPGGGTPGMELGLYAKTWHGGSVATGYDFDYYRVSAVPEPGAIALLVSGLIALLAYAWRKRK